MHEHSTRGFARQLRGNATPAEQRLWGCLRKRSLGGLRFVRQATIGPYIADFLCRELRLVIEVDGATHGDAAEIRHDQARSRFLADRGYAVLRVQNMDVHERMGDVLDGIVMAAGERQPVFQKRSDRRTPSGLRPPPPAKLGGG